MKNTLIIIVGFVTAIVTSSCVSSSSRPFYIPEIAISELEETVIGFDSARYAGINLIVKNDTGSDIFMLSTYRGLLLTTPARPDEQFLFPDEEEFCADQSPGHMPIKVRNLFTYISTGNKGAYHVYSDPPKSGITYYLPVTYYHTTEARFYTRSVRVTTNRE